MCEGGGGAASGEGDGETVEGEEMSWTQPMCEDCYANREPERVPVRLTQPEVEICCMCGAETREGIYYRVDPSTVPFPHREEV